MFRRLVICVTLAAFTGLIVGEVAAQGTTHTICFYVDAPDHWWNTGHVFVQLLPTTGPDAGRKDLVSGHYPDGWKIFGGAGQNRDDSLRPWDWKICYAVTTAAYDAVAGGVRADRLAPPPYHLFSGNCVDWAIGIASTAGVTLPATTNFLGIDDPRKFANSLEAIGPGPAPGGGNVVQNPVPGSTASGGPDPPPVVYPDQCSYAGMEEWAFQSSVVLAEALHLESHQEAFGPETLTVGQTFTVSLSNVDLSNAMVVYDWGDGSTHTHQTTSASHSYSSTGNFVVGVIVIDTGAVNEFSVVVEVGATAGGGSVSISVPTPPPNGPYVPPPDSRCPNNADPPPVCPSSSPPAGVPTVSEWGLITLGGLLLIVGVLGSRRGVR